MSIICCVDQLSKLSTAVPINHYTNKFILHIFEHSKTAFSGTTNLPTEYEESVLDCIFHVLFCFFLCIFCFKLDFFKENFFF